jgi:hypothetical protein
MMSPIRVGSAIIAFLSLLSPTLISQRVSAETNALKLIVQADSVSVVLPNTEAAVLVNVINISDSITAFALRMRLENNDNVHFAIDSVGHYGSDSTCFAKIESIGARIQSWELIAATVSFDSIGEVLFVTGFCDDGAFPTILPLRPGSGTLFRAVLKLDRDFPLSLCNTQLSPLRLIDSSTTFYNPAGELIGFNCTVSDSIDTTCILDSTEALYLDGAVTSWCCLWNNELYQCGDCDANGMISISDAVCMISWIFAWPGPDSKPPCMRFANGDGMVSVSDIVHLINYIFASGPAPRCE